jgi:hypothetical protein
MMQIPTAGERTTDRAAATAAVHVLHDAGTAATLASWPRYVAGQQDGEWLVALDLDGPADDVAAALESIGCPSDFAADEAARLIRRGY